MGTPRRLRAVLGIQPKDYSGLLEKGKAVYTGLSEHPALFPAPTLSLPLLLDKIVALDMAQQLTLTRTKGAVGARNLKAAEVVTGLEMERAYVQSLADASPEQAQVIIEAAGMSVAGTSNYVKPFLHAKQDVPSGAVHVFVNVGVLTAGATGKVLYEWQSSSDGGTTWISAQLTPYGHVDFEGLIAAQTYGFRVRFTDLKGAHAWSPILTYVVQ